MWASEQSQDVARFPKDKDIDDWERGRDRKQDF